MKIKKSDVEKLRREGSSEWKKFKEEYTELTENMGNVANPTLFLLCIIGASMVVYFDAIIFKFIGLLIFAYGVYAFAMREGHRDGYFDRCAKTEVGHPAVAGAENK